MSNESMSKKADYQEWQIAKILSQPEKLFILWLIKDSLYKSREDFADNFAEGKLINELLQELVQKGFLMVRENAFVLSDVGEATLTRLERGKSHTTTNSQPIVLIIEDELPIAEALAFIIEDAGYTSLIASNGREALKILQERTPTLIFSDFMLPQMSGPELIQALRSGSLGEEKARIPIVLMSGAGFLAHSSADAIIHKPFTSLEIERLLSEYLTR